MRSNDGDAALGGRGSRNGCTESKSATYVPESRSDISEQVATRDAVEDFTTAIANLAARGSDVEQEAHAHGSSDKAFDVVERNVPDGFTTEAVTHAVPEDDFHSVMLSGRDLSSGQDIQARNFLSNVIKAMEGGSSDATSPLSSSPPAMARKIS